MRSTHESFRNKRHQKMKLLVSLLPCVAASYSLTERDVEYARQHRSMLPKDLQDGELTMERLAPFVKPHISVSKKDTTIYEGVGNGSGVDPSEVWQIGKEVWELVQENTAVVNYTTDYAGAKPARGNVPSEV